MSKETEQALRKLRLLAGNDPKPQFVQPLSEPVYPGKKDATCSEPISSVPVQKQKDSKTDFKMQKKPTRLSVLPDRSPLMEDVSKRRHSTFHQVVSPSSKAQGDGDWEYGCSKGGYDTSSPESAFDVTPDEYVPSSEHRYSSSIRENDRVQNGFGKPPKSLPIPSPVYATESQLVRDLFTVLQGFDGAYIRLTDTECRIRSTAQIKEPDIEVVLKIGYVGQLFKSLSNICQIRETGSPNGLCGNGVVSVLREELNEYRKRVSELDAQLCREETKDGSNMQKASSSHLTLMFLLSAMTEEALRLQILTNIACSMDGLTGGQLITCLYNKYRQGHSLLRGILARMINRAMEPLLRQIKQWVLYGIIEDVHNEFFVTDNASAPVEHVWTSRYQLKPDSLLYCISPELAEEILLAGKSVAFSRHVCGKRLNAANEEEVQWADGDAVWDSQNIRFKFEGEQQLGLACRRSSEALVKLLKEEYHLEAQFRVFHKFILLGMEDFTHSLMDQLGNYLNEYADHLFVKNMMPIITDAIRNSAGGSEPLEITSGIYSEIVPVGRELGWDAFVLGYRVKGPLKSVISDSVLQTYRRIFSFIWRVKRTSYMLHEAWKIDSFSRLSTMEQIDFVDLIHPARLLFDEMRTFVMQFQSAFSAHVHGTLWRRFLEQLGKAISLNDVVASHNVYLADVEDACFMKHKPKDASQELETHFRAIIDGLIKYCHFISSLTLYAVSPVVGNDRALREAIGKFKGELDGHQMRFKNERNRFLTLLDSLRTDYATDLVFWLDQTASFRRAAQVAPQKSEKPEFFLNLAGLA